VAALNGAAICVLEAVTGAACRQKLAVGYTFGITTGIKTAISIPDDLFAAAEKLASELELSRSALYAKALREMIQRLNDAAITAQTNAALQEAPNPKAAPGFSARMRRELERDGGQW
jgi:predicted transcriptional regulator